MSQLLEVTLGPGWPHGLQRQFTVEQFDFFQASKQETVPLMYHLLLKAPLIKSGPLRIISIISLN